MPHHPVQRKGWHNIDISTTAGVFLQANGFIASNVYVRRTESLAQLTDDFTVHFLHDITIRAACIVETEHHLGSVDIDAIRVFKSHSGMYGSQVHVGFEADIGIVVIGALRRNPHPLVMQPGITSKNSTYHGGGPCNLVLLRLARRAFPMC